MPLPEPIGQEHAAPRRWLSIVGVGEDGVDGLTSAARDLIERAEIVFGGRRHLRLAAPLIRGIARGWPTPFDRAIDAVLEYAARRVCVLASGDPFMFGVGPVLVRSIAPQQMIVIPAPSAFSLAAARLGWSLPETTLLSLHARSLDLIRPHLQPRSRLLVLTSDAHAPAAIAQLMVQAGFGPSRLTVLEALGGPRENIREATAADFAIDAIGALNTVGIKVAAGPDARVLPRASGLPDHLFEHDGLLTKREIRALTLSALAPRRSELLWDVGAGAGSVGIEWMLTDLSLRAVAIERRAERAARIRRNAAALGVPGLQIREGSAPAAFGGLEQPQAIFIGGGGGDPGVLDAAVDALGPGGRLVVNAITLETEAQLLARGAALGGELTRLAVTRAASVGGMSGWRPAMPVTQWSWVKP